MGRKPLYDENTLLDAAVQLVREGGPAAVTMSAVARGAGAPSGSVYHRFAERPQLLGALWLRSLTRFHEVFLGAIEGGDAREGLVRGARAVVAWCGDHRGDAEILSFGPESFGYSDWDRQARAALDEANERLVEGLRRAGERMGAVTKRDFEGITIAVVDVPYASVRRYLRGDAPMPDYVADLVAVAASAMLGEVAGENSRASTGESEEELS
ncbi:TetR/AcrR family transcriptional regulator [Rhodococcus sp. NPDC058521]|uniref:TetR/AcrR family transcriptional regulator n=1 Tax=Rhodococcus sp. NPDC058521 TaxID=3346536 RepID=UPI003667ECF1